MGKGFLKAEVFTGDHAIPIKGANVLISNKKGDVLYNLITDENGITDEVYLDAPDKKDLPDLYSVEPYFFTYECRVTAHGYQMLIIHDIEIFDTITSILPAQMYPNIIGDPDNIKEIFIPIEHGIDFQRDLSNQTDLDNYNTTQINLANEVSIPEYVSVHLGSPNDNAARNVRVPFKDYVKNVASSEIFPTWHESALYANIYAQISFVLNRVHTVWYRSRGKDFDITNNTAFDQFFVEGREIFQNISRIVDGIFNMFLRRPGRREPFFAAYCNGTTSTCAGLSQWGSQNLALQGYTPMEILRYYYPNDIQIVESNNFTSRIGTFGGVSLQEGSSGEAVRTMQLYLNRISGNWYISPIPNPNGSFGSETRNSVMDFQGIFNLIADGIIGKGTWYEITKVYVAVKELAELTSEGERISVGASPPTVTISLNSRGEYVVELQFLLNFIGLFFPAVPFVVQNGVFQAATKRSVIEFQREFGLTADGVVGPQTWQKFYDVYHSIQGNAIIPPPSPSIPPFPGVPLRIGAQGSDVLLMQNYLNAIARFYPSIPILVADGNFGPLTQQAVIAFQRQFGLVVDGVIGQMTWYEIVEVYEGLPTGETPQFPGTPLSIGSRSNTVMTMQNYLNTISTIFPIIPSISADGNFGTNTQAAVIAFQTLFGLTPDGVIGEVTWDKIVDIFNNLPDVSAPQFPGTSLRVGSRGNDVILMQNHLNAIGTRYSSIPALNVDGIFGNATQQAVMAYQRLFGLTDDGIIGRVTWNHIVSIFNLLNMNSMLTEIYTTSSHKPQEKSSPFNMFAMLLMLSMSNRN